MVKQAYLCSFWSAPKYKYSFKVLENYNQAMALDTKNGNTNGRMLPMLNWHRLMSMRPSMTMDTKTRSGHLEGTRKLVKHDGQHKAKLVADGHLTDTPLESM